MPSLFRFPLAVWCALAVLCGFTAPLHAQMPPQTASPWQVRFDAARGLALAYRGVPIIRRSSLYVVKPGWSGLLFDQRAQTISSEQRGAGDLKISARNADFAASYDLIPLDDTTFELHFHGEMQRDVPAQIEFAAGYFNANLIANRPFEATKTDANAPVSSGRVPAFPRSDELMKNDLAPDFRALSFDSRLGQIRVEVESQSRVAFADARRDSQNWAKEAPVFWCGWMAGAQPLRFGAPVEMTLRIHIEAPVLNPQIRPIAAISPAQSPAPDALSTRDKPLEIVPRPQHLSVETGAPFLLSRGAAVRIAARRGETRLGPALQRILREQWQIETAPPRQIPSPSSWSRIVIGALPDSLSEASEASGPNSRPRPGAWSTQTDAYRLRADRHGIEIEAPTARGAFYGLQTLGQILRPRAAGAGVAPVEIEDFASLGFRGAHWFPSASGVPFHKRLIQVMARAKMNVAVIQCEAARWDSHPEIAGPNSISKADLRALVAECRANFIEPIPLINTPGHAEWMFRNGQNGDLAEDPQTPYAYAVNNPQSQKFIHQILSEAIEVFHPKTFHIGHDEVTLRGRFPNPDSRFYQPNQSATDLVMGNLRSLHDWLGARGIKTMVWSDMFLHPDEGPAGQTIDAASAPSTVEAQKRRALLPKDVIVADWHYGGNEKYPSLEVFRRDGLQTVAATWNTPQNIRYFSRAARQNRSAGLLQTTWAGYFPDAQTLDTQLSQFTAFILAGDYAWSGRDDAPQDVGYDPTAQWSAAYAPQPGGESTGTLLDLTSAAQVAPRNWLGLGEGRDLSALFEAPSHAPRFDDIRFQLPPRKLVVLSQAPAELAPPGSLGSLEIQINARAAQIALLHSSLWSVPDGTLAARMHIEYADGTSSNFDLQTGRTLASWQGEGVAVNARRGWSTKTADGAVGLRVTRWQNPHPEKTIARLQFSPVDAEAGYVLAGVTLIEK